MISTMNVHEVTRIELSNAFPSNGNSRTLRIEVRGGSSFELTVFGKTEALDAVEKASNFRVSEPRKAEVSI